MAILAECPICRKKQAVKNKRCPCGENLDKAKRSNRVRYWIVYRLPNKKQRKEYVEKSIEEAQLAEGKRKVQKYETPDILEKAAEEKKTFNELTLWYLDLSNVKRLRSYTRVKQCLSNFNKSFGDHVISKIKPIDLEEYQSKREDEGVSPATIDMELSIAKTMINKAFDNDIISSRILKVFRSYDRKLKRGSNARRRVIDAEEYSRLILSSSPHLVPILIVAHNTGMRLGEIRKLQWAYIDRKKISFACQRKLLKKRNQKLYP